MANGNDKPANPSRNTWFLCEPVERACGGRLLRIICLRCGEEAGVAGSEQGKQACKKAHELCCRRGNH